MERPSLAHYRAGFEASLEASAQAGVSWADVEQAHAAGRALLIRGRDGRSAMLVEQSREINLWLVTGDLKELVRMESHLVRFAQDRGFTRICAEEGRPGWDRVLPRLGYRGLRSLVKDI